MSDTESHEFIPPDGDEFDDEAAGPECQSCGSPCDDCETYLSIVPCPTCGGNWCFECFDEHIKEEPDHIQK